MGNFFSFLRRSPVGYIITVRRGSDFLDETLLFLWGNGGQTSSLGRAGLEGVVEREDGVLLVEAQPLRGQVGPARGTGVDWKESRWEKATQLKNKWAWSKPLNPTKSFHFEIHAIFFLA